VPEFESIETMRFARNFVSVVVVTLVVFIAAWVGCRFYLQRQVTLLVADLRSLDAAHDSNGQAKILMKKYRSHFIDRRCIEDYCPDRFLFTNRILSTFHLAPRSEIEVTFEWVGGSLRDVHISYTSAVFKENSPVVAISEMFCTDQFPSLCDYIALNPHGRNVSQTWNGDVSFSQRVTPETRKAGWGLNPACFTALRGCKNVSELLPTLWKVTSPGTVSSRMRSDADSIAEAAQPLPD
jgi:hypothetical protein